MARKYVNLNHVNEKRVKHALAQLVKQDIDSADYRIAFSELGNELGSLIAEKNPDMGKVLLVCASEDADWLAKGLKDNLHEDTGLAVLWTHRIVVCDSPKVEVSTIDKSYIDMVGDTCDTMIIVKSIISTSCVVKSQVNYLIQRVRPKNIIIAAPVMFVDAKESLIKEFPKDISSKFSFIAFAIDDKRDMNGVVFPGVGGMVYPKLGLGDADKKNYYMPQLVRERAFASMHA